MEFWQERNIFNLEMVYTDSIYEGMVTWSLLVKDDPSGSHGLGITLLIFCILMKKALA